MKIHIEFYLCKDCNAKTGYKENASLPRNCNNCGSTNTFKKGGEVRPKGLHDFLDKKVNSVK